MLYQRSGPLSLVLMTFVLKKQTPSVAEEGFYIDVSRYLNKSGRKKRVRIRQ